VKIDTDINGEILIPKSITSKMTKRPDIYEKDEKIINVLCDSDGKIVDKEIAEFLEQYVTGNIPEYGGYPISGVLTFDNKGDIITVLAFGWNNGDKNADFYMVGYKEIKIKNKETN
jgi:hypothetical protein